MTWKNTNTLFSVVTHSTARTGQVPHLSRAVNIFSVQTQSPREIIKISKNKQTPSPQPQIYTYNYVAGLLSIKGSNVFTVETVCFHSFRICSAGNQQSTVKPDTSSPVLPVVQLSWRPDVTTERGQCCIVVSVHMKSWHDNLIGPSIIIYQICESSPYIYFTPNYYYYFYSIIENWLKNLVAVIYCHKLRINFTILTSTALLYPSVLFTKDGH